MRILFYMAAGWERLESVPWYSKAAGIAAAGVSAIVGDFMTGALVLAALASLVDWYYGRAVAKKEGRFDKERASEGWQTKSGTLMIVLLIRGLEAWLATAPEPFSLSTHGAIAAAISVGILADELDSIDENLKLLGGRGVPFLSPLLTWLRNTASRFAGNPRAPTDGR